MLLKDFLILTNYLNLLNDLRSLIIIINPFLFYKFTLELILCIELELSNVLKEFSILYSISVDP
jgi:hypothetical protein